MRNSAFDDYLVNGGWYEIRMPDYAEKEDDEPDDSEYFTIDFDFSDGSDSRNTDKKGEDTLSSSADQKYFTIDFDSSDESDSEDTGEKGETTSPKSDDKLISPVAFEQQKSSPPKPMNNEPNGLKSSPKLNVRNPFLEASPPILQPSPQEKPRGSPLKGGEQQKITPYGLAELLKLNAVTCCIDGLVYVFKDPIYRQLENNDESIKLLKSFLDTEERANISIFDWGHCIKHLLTDPDIDIKQESWRNKDDVLAVFANGVVKKPWKIKPSKPEYYLFSFCKAVYNPENRERHNGVFDQYLWDVSGGDIELIRLIKAVIGAILSQASVFKKAFMFIGGTDCGKSVLCALIRRLVGINNVSNVPLYKFDKPFQMSEMRGKQANIFADDSSISISPNVMSIFKSMVSGLDVINANVKFGVDTKLMGGKTRMLFSFNSFPIPSKNDDLDAYLNRWIIIPFRYKIPRKTQNGNIIDQLMREKDYIIYSALSAFWDVKNNNYIFPYCETSERAIEEYRNCCTVHRPPSMEDIMESFVRSSCVIDETAREHSSVLWEAYRDYCLSQGLDIATQTAFSLFLQQRYCLEHVKFRKTGGGKPLNGLIGIRLADGNESEIEGI